MLVYAIVYLTWNRSIVYCFCCRYLFDLLVHWSQNCSIKIAV